MARKLTVKIIDDEKYEEATGSKKPSKGTVNLFPEEVEHLYKIEAVELTPMQKALIEGDKKDEEETNPTSKEALEIAKREDFFDLCIKEVQKKVVGEERTIKTVGIVANTRLVENADATSSNAAPNEESGTGKDFVTRNTLFIFVPKESLIYRTRISPTVLNYWHNPKFEPNWTWNGKVLYLEDISDNILNSDVMKTFLSGGSKATVVMKQMVVDIHIKGKPTILMTFANATPNNEMLRRLQLIPLDSTKQQTERIKKFKAKKASIGEYEGKDERISEAISSLKRIKVKIPEAIAEGVITYFPNTTIVRTNLDRFFDYMKSSCAFHQHNRSIDDSGYYLAEGQDYDIARDIFLYVTFSKSMIPISKNQKKLLDIFTLLIKDFEYVRKTKFSVAEIQNKVTFLSRKALYYNLDALSDTGFLKKDNEEEEHGGGDTVWTKDVTVYSRSYGDVFTLPKYNELINQESATLTTLGKQGKSTTQGTQGVSLPSVKGQNTIITPLKGGSVDGLPSLPQLEENKKNESRIILSICSGCTMGIDPETAKIVDEQAFCDDCAKEKELSLLKEGRGSE